ncbi:hypothetical protein CMI47_17555 [Candidatus Pacearchaeota archaeon]|nr:hypothetical protein [Candidatus Pacearchaeota archaeon]|tara:strand:+ start:2716 stop:2916 length:201 start_codon:yes stop_codon:yes gene_type:complete
MPEKIRVNVSIDKALLEKAKGKLDLFGGKLSTLFNAYLRDFVKGSDGNFGEKIKELEKRVERLEKD